MLSSLVKITKVVQYAVYLWNFKLKIGLKGFSMVINLMVILVLTYVGVIISKTYHGCLM